MACPPLHRFELERSISSAAGRVPKKCSLVQKGSDAELWVQEEGNMGGNALQRASSRNTGGICRAARIVAVSD